MFETVHVVCITAMEAGGNLHHQRMWSGGKKTQERHIFSGFKLQKSPTPKTYRMYNTFRLQETSHHPGLTSQFLISQAKLCPKTLSCECYTLVQKEQNDQSLKKYLSFDGTV